MGGVSVIQELQNLFVGNLTGALGAIWGILEPLWVALIAIVVSWGCAMSALSKATDATVGACIRGVFSLVLSGGVLQNIGTLIDSSIASAGDLAGIAGGDPPGAAPLSIAQAGVNLFAQAADHAGSQIGVMPWSFNLMGLIIYPTGVILLLSYLLIAFLVALALVELLVGAITLAPAYVFLGAPGFSSVAFHPIGHLWSCVFRLAGLSFISAYGLALVQGTPLPDMGAEMTLLDCVTVLAIAGFLALAAIFGDRVITKSLSGGAGVFSNAGPAAAGMMRSAAGSFGGGGGGGGGSGSRGSLGGGGGGGSSGGSSGGRPGTMSTASWARRPA